MNIALKIRLTYEAADRAGLLQEAAQLYNGSPRYTHQTLMVTNICPDHTGPTWVMVFLITSR